MQPTFDLSRESSRTTAATIRSLEKNWQTAIKEHDFGAVQMLLADDFEGTSSTGRKGRKAKLLTEVGKDKNVYSSARVRGMKVRSLEPNVAVVTGIASETGTTPEGKRFKSARRFTDKWEYRDGRWQCVASEAERLPQE